MISVSNRSGYARSPSSWSSAPCARDYLSMTKCEVGQRLRERAGSCIVEAVESYNDGREHDWIFIDTGELAGRH